MYLRDVAVYADEEIVDRFPSGFVGWFHRESCCITEWYVNLLYRRIANPDTAKVHLLFTDQESSVPAVKQLLDVADARWLFDFRAYVGMDELGKKRLILDALQSALLWIAKERRWDLEALNDAYGHMLDQNLVFDGFSKKVWFSPDRKHKARIGFSYELRRIQFFLTVFDRKGTELGRRELGAVVPEMGLVHWILKQKPVWNARNVFSIPTQGYSLRLPKQWQVNLSELVR